MIKLKTTYLWEGGCYMYNLILGIVIVLSIVVCHCDYDAAKQAKIVQRMHLPAVRINYSANKSSRL